MTKQRGNILFLILLAIILFVALTYAVNSGMRGGGKSGSAESAKSAASAILNNATMMQQAVNRMMLTNGCRESELSFEDPYDTGYVNNARADGSCKLFAPNGGGLEYPVPDDNWMDKDWESDQPNFWKKWYFYNKTCVPGIGTGGTTACWNDGTLTDNDLVVFLPFVKKDICKAINDTIAQDMAWSNNDVYFASGGAIDFGPAQKYTGEFIGYSGTNSHYINTFTGQHYGCFQRDANGGASGTPPGGYVFFQVLLAR